MNAVKGIPLPVNNQKVTQREVRIVTRSPHKVNGQLKKKSTLHFERATVFVSTSIFYLNTARFAKSPNRKTDHNRRDEIESDSRDWHHR